MGTNEILLIKMTAYVWYHRQKLTHLYFLNKLMLFWTLISCAIPVCPKPVISSFCLCDLPIWTWNRYLLLCYSMQETILHAIYKRKLIFPHLNLQT